MTIDEIRELINLVKETGVAELEVERGDKRVRIRQYTAAETSVLIPSLNPAPGPFATALAGNVQHVPAVSETKAESAAAKADANVMLVKSPIVGTFYESPSPDSPPFVRIGEHVTAGKILCIIESMKLMNEIEADVAGIVESRLVQSGQPVEYGEALFGIRPV